MMLSDGVHLWDASKCYDVSMATSVAKIHVAPMYQPPQHLTNTTINLTFIPPMLSVFTAPTWTCTGFCYNIVHFCKHCRELVISKCDFEYIVTMLSRHSKIHHGPSLSLFGYDRSALCLKSHSSANVGRRWAAAYRFCEH